MSHCALAAALFASVATAQDPTALILPRTIILGPLPAAALTLALHEDGTLRDGADRQFDRAALQRLLAQPPAELVLQVDQKTPFAVVDAVLDVCRLHLQRVHFEAVLPDGRAGCFTLALPAANDLATTIDLRLHRERAGVPVDSARLILQRMQRGAGAPLLLGVEAPGDAPFEQVLQALAAIALADVKQVQLRSASTKAQQVAWQRQQDFAALAVAGGSAPPRALAMDLGPSPRLQLLPLALPAPQPARRDVAFGCTERAEAGATAPPAGGAGGRYAARAGGAVRVDATAAATEQASGWLRRQQDDGSFADVAGPGDVEGTALVLLACLGDGSTLRAGGRRDVIRRGIGWLLAQQRSDGLFGEPGPGATAPQAMATYALAEVHGLSGEGLLRGALEDALFALTAQQLADGGFGDGSPGAAADTVTTSWCTAALLSAKFFGCDVQQPVAASAKWFDTVADQTTGLHRLRAAAAADESMTPTAAALFSRFFLGQSPKEVPIMDLAAGQLVEHADASDPLCAYWTTYALYQVGGKPWSQWSQRLTKEVVAAQRQDGEFKGSWDPPPRGSRLRTTALRMLTLQAYYRYTRLVR